MQFIEPLIDAAKLRAATFVRHVEVHETLGSTNDRAAELARQLPADELPALVVARRQTAGRGRGKHIWLSADGALTFSLLIEPATLGIAVANWPQLSLATAVAVVDALAAAIDNGELGPEDSRAGQPPAPSPQPPRVGIKWPNDVLVAGRKVCGILIESPGGAAAAGKRLVIGIGVNVNNSLRDAPPDAAASGTALCDVTGRIYPLQDVLIDILSALTVRIEQLRAGDPALAGAWNALDVFAGRPVVVETAGRRIEGHSLGIAADGALVVETTAGNERLFSGSVRLGESPLGGSVLSGPRHS